MSWLPAFASGWAAWFFCLLGPLILFYFLKLRRPRLEVPSIMLWRQVMDDQRVNSPFQRFKRHLLLLLQILLLLLLVTAATQPFIQGRAERVSRLPVLIDCSASMAALAEPGGKSRLELAKAKVRERIDGLLPDQAMCLIAFSGRARKLTGFTNNKRLLERALDQLVVEDVESDLEDALRLTQALARQAWFDEVLLLSDGNLPARTNFELSFTLAYERLGPAGDNLGITATSAKLSREGTWHVFVEVSATGEEERAGEVVLRSGEDELGREGFRVGSARSARIAFEVDGEQAHSMRIDMKAEGFDALARDDVAFLELPAIRPLLVYVPQEMEAFALALHTLPGVTLSAKTEDNYDLAITDRADDLGIETRTRLTVGLLPENVKPLMSFETDAGDEIVDWDRRSGLLQHVVLGDVVLIDRATAGEEVRDAKFEELGYEILLHGSKGPLLLRRRSEGKLDYHLLFHTDRSTLPYRIGFPVLMANLVLQARAESGLGEIRGARAGLLPELRLSADTSYVVSGPEGVDSTSGRSDKTGRLVGVPAPRAGIYVVSDGGSPVARVGVALLSPSESGLAGVDEIMFNEALSVSASEAQLPSDKPLWPVLAWIALVVLLAEWWLFNNRRIR